MMLLAGKAKKKTKKTNEMISEKTGTSNISIGLYMV